MATRKVLFQSKVTGKTAKIVRANSKFYKTISIGKSVKINGRKYKISAIGKNAFAKLNGLEQLSIKTKNLKLIGKNAIRSGKETVNIIVPKGCRKQYKKLLKKAGIKTFTITTR